MSATYKDVAFKMIQAELTEEDLRALGASKKTLLRAAFFLQEQKEPEKARQCFEMANSIFPDNRGRGPQANSDRYYTVQRDTRGSLFVRVPPSTLGVEKGGKVLAKFKQGKIELTAGFDS